MCRPTRWARGASGAGSRPATAIDSGRPELKGLRFPEIETRVFAADHTLGDEELSALAAWWLRRERR
jgi:hypothetical protein